MRDISTITNEEAAELWNAVMSFGVKPFRGNFYPFEGNEKSPARLVLWSGVERLGIYFTGKVWADSDLHLIELDQNKVAEYLESIGIELVHQKPDQPCATS